MASPGTYRGPSNGGDMAPFPIPLNSPMHYTAHDAALLCSGLGRLAPADITALAYSARDVSVICFHTGRTTTRAQTSLMIRCI